VSPTLTIGLDLGTTAVKAAVLDPRRGVIAQASRINRLSSPHPGWAEADPAQWLRNAADAVREVAATVGEHRIAAIATSGMVPAMVAVDHLGVPVRAAILQNDARASAEVDELAITLQGQEPLARTGSPISQQSVAPKILWLQRHEPEAWSRTALVVGSYDWLLMALGARDHVERNWALESGLFELAGTPYEPLLRVAPQIRPILPGPVAGGTPVGELSADAARLLGLRAGIPLVAGGADHVLSAYGAGLSRPGDWLVKLGGAGDILVVSRHPVTDSRFFLDEHPIPGLYLPNGCMATSGSLVRWVQSLVGSVDLAGMDEDAGRRPAGEILCLPYFLGEKTPWNDPDLRGVLAGLHLGHSASDVYRAALEGVAFGFRHNVESFQDRGLLLERATVTNGGATSLLWKQIHASVLGVPLRTVVGHPGAALGAAALAACGVGALTGPERIADFVRPGPTVHPVEALARRYDEIYPLWRELGAAVAPTMRAFARS
jgi:xylulokinase